MKPLGKLCSRFVADHPEEAAKAAESLPAGDMARVLDMLETEQAAALCKSAAPLAVRDAVAALAPEVRAQILSEVPPRIAAMILRRLEEPVRVASLKQLKESTRVAVELLLHHPEGTAGALMDPAYLALHEDVTAAEAIDHIRKHPDQITSHLFTLDRANKLRGWISLREVVTADTSSRLGGIDKPATVRLSAFTNLDTVLGSEAWDDAEALPVVNDKGEYIGAIRWETVRQHTDDEDTPPKIDPVLNSASALGELYRLGLTGLMQSIDQSPPRKESTPARKPKAP